MIKSKIISDRTKITFIFTRWMHKLYSVYFLLLSNAKRCEKYRYLSILFLMTQFVLGVLFSYSLVKLRMNFYLATMIYISKYFYN